MKSDAMAPQKADSYVAYSGLSDMRDDQRHGDGEQSQRKSLDAPFIPITP